MGNISFGLAFVAGRNLVPKPATGKTTVFIEEFYAIMKNKLKTLV